MVIGLAPAMSSGDELLRQSTMAIKQTRSIKGPRMSYWALEMRRLTMSLMRCSTRLIGDGGERSFTDSGDVWRERNGQDRTVEASPS
jgi:hypothetical protein